MIEAASTLTTDKAVKLFEKFGIFTKVELESREEIIYETYAKTINIEALTMSETVLNASRLMKKYNVGSIPVIDESSQVVGIITDRDIVVRVFADILPMNTKVSEVMTHPVHTIIETAEVGEAISLMADKQVRRLPVVDNNSKLVGMISLGDLAIHQLSRF